MKYTLEDLIKGKVSCINDGTLDELKLVLKTAFPNDKTETSGSYNYYFLHNTIKDEWGRSDKTDKPTQSVKEFVKEINEAAEEKIYTLEDLRKGNVLCHYNGTLEELQLVLKHVFPEDRQEAGGSATYYLKHHNHDNLWMGSDFHMNKPTQSIKEFVKQIKQETMENKNQFATREQIKQIYNIACDAWKEKLLNKIQQFPFEVEIPFTEKEVDEMFAACVNNQAETLEKIFTRPVDKNPFKKGVKNSVVLKFSEEIFGDGRLLQQVYSSTPKDRPELESRAFFVPERINIELIKVKDGHVIAFNKK